MIQFKDTEIKKDKVNAPRHEGILKVNSATSSTTVEGAEMPCVAFNARDTRHNPIWYATNADYLDRNKMDTLWADS